MDKLNDQERRDAITKPVEDARCPVKFGREAIERIADLSGGDPYFVQFIGREVYEVWLQRLSQGKTASVPTQEIIRKLDSDFFAGRWARATDRQRELLAVVSRLRNCDLEFTLQEIVEESRKGPGKPFSSSHVNQMLSAMGKAGLVYKNRHGRYSLAVPLLGEYIRRTLKHEAEP